jgi:hypothetical protein
MTDRTSAVRPRSGIVSRIERRLPAHQSHSVVRPYCAGFFIGASADRFLERKR